MKEETGQKRREVTLPLVIFDPSKSCGSSFDLTRQSYHDIDDNRNGNISRCTDGNTADKKCAKARQLHKKVSV